MEELGCHGCSRTVIERLWKMPIGGWMPISRMALDAESSGWKAPDAKSSGWKAPDAKSSGWKAPDAKWSRWMANGL
jgi:hypothetical protein